MLEISVIWMTLAGRRSFKEDRRYIKALWGERPRRNLPVGRAHPEPSDSLSVRLGLSGTRKRKISVGARDHAVTHHGVSIHQQRLFLQSSSAIPIRLQLSKVPFVLAVALLSCDTYRIHNVFSLLVAPNIGTNNNYLLPVTPPAGTFLHLVYQRVTVSIVILIAAPLSFSILILLLVHSLPIPTMVPVLIPNPVFV
ncbi:hypothetical protein EVAR_46010_1 [Eumeta japonica]|uniref:Uncharacterized protein n=1 Tax=Eumeta variegata TaxID=151549 RepID=A0A4C1X9S6_EUMVA|nr:hypothetical protein EVAR_46010_1 [Eumeta japonica]